MGYSFQTGSPFQYSRRILCSSLPYHPASITKWRKCLLPSSINPHNHSYHLQAEPPQASKALVPTWPWAPHGKRLQSPLNQDWWTETIECKTRTGSSVVHTGRKGPRWVFGAPHWSRRLGTMEWATGSFPNLRSSALPGASSTAEHSLNGPVLHLDGGTQQVACTLVAIRQGGTTTFNLGRMVIMTIDR